MNTMKKCNLGLIVSLASSAALYSTFRSSPEVIVQPCPVTLDEIVTKSVESNNPIMRETVSKSPVAKVKEELSKILTDEEFVNDLFYNSNSPFSLVNRDEYEKRYGLFPNQKCFTEFYSTLCNNFSNNSLENIAQTIPRNDPLWVDLPDVWNLVYNVPHDKETTLNEVYADKIPSKEEIASQWNPETRKIFNNIVELSMYDDMIDGFLIREAVRTRPRSNEAAENLEIDMIDYMPFIRNNLGSTPDAAVLEVLIGAYGKFSILEVNGQVTEGTSDLISRAIYGILESQRAILESQYGNSQLTNMLRLNKAFNDHSDSSE